MKKIIGVVLLIVVVIGGVVAVKKKREQIASLPTPAVKSVTVETVQPKRMHIEQKRLFIGRYESIEHPQIASKISGFVQHLHVEEGDRVKKGDLLISIDDKDLTTAVLAQKASIKALESVIDSLRLSLEALKNDYLYAQSVYERNLKLFKADALPKEQLEQSKVAMQLKHSKYLTTQKSISAKQEELKALKAQLQAKINQLRYAQIHAPIDGVVANIFLREGDLALPGKPLMTLLGEKKRVEFQFPMVEFQRIAKGMKVYINGLESTIHQILPESEKALAVARINLQTVLNLPEKSNVNVEVVQKEAEGTGVPVNALLEKGDETYLFIYHNHAFVPQKVNVLAKDAHYAIVDREVTNPVAVGSNDKLSKLFVLKDVKAVRHE